MLFSLVKENFTKPGSDAKPHQRNLDLGQIVSTRYSLLLNAAYYNVCSEVKGVHQPSLHAVTTTLQCYSSKDLDMPVELDENDPVMLFMGSGWLHTIKNALKNGTNATGLNVICFLRPIYNAFKDVPARRSDYSSPMVSLVLTDSFEKLPDQIMYPYAEPYDLQKHVFKCCGLFNTFIGEQEYRPVWRPIQPCETDVQPGMRGGHQMCMDPYTETIYLFGGWDGNQDLSDLWTYHVPTHKWTLIMRDTEVEGGPSARSCHKVCIDPDRRQIFTLGRYLDMLCRTPGNLKLANALVVLSSTAEDREIEVRISSDFYMYDIDSNSWTLISEDTGEMGGPQLIFDHQMSMDVEQRKIYVFGGRVLTPHTAITFEERSGTCGMALVGSSNSDPTFSGLYCYHVSTNTWTKLCDDCSRPSSPGFPTIRSRVGHSMLFHPGCRKLFVFAGQRSKEYLNDFFTYNVDTQEIQQISEGTKKEPCNIPAAGFTQRATIDPELNEIYVLSGLSKDKEKRDDNVQNSFWVYYIAQNKWSCIYRNENTGEHYWSKMQHLEPCPRFAHQLVYDPCNKVHYLFGGNPGRSCLPRLRLDDFWQLQLCRPSHEQILQKCKLFIRKHRFEELAVKDRMAALQYLQTSLSEIIDHEDSEQTKEFQLLASVLFQEQDEKETPLGAGHSVDESGCHHRRSQLFDQLIEFFPSFMSQPKANLIDLISL
uniref:(California timema) hypothetical protein n=1 Tax=Timema californicum TaxID=61474 RepID=A0A7R9J3X3_TIMCA|nr:unnamed protein product [Timema californicum]